MKKRIVLLVICSITSASIFTACEKKTDNISTSTNTTITESKSNIIETQVNSNKKEYSSEKETEESSNEAKAGDINPSEVIVTDMAGRKVTLPAEVKSIATFGSIGVINAFVELMGEGDKICNQMTAGFTKSDKWKMQYEFAPQITDAPLLQNADGEILIEEVLKVKPDLCLVMSKDLIEPLESNGLNVIYFEWKQTDDVKTAVTLMGDALGKQDLAKDYITYFDTTISKAADLTKQLDEESKKTVLYGNVSKLNQPHVIAEWWIKAAGGKSVTDDGRTEGNSLEYTIEDLLLWNPQVIFVTDPSVIEEINADSKLENIFAIKNKAVYCVPTVAHVWGNRTVEQPLTVLWAANKMYPELVTDEMLADEIAYFYKHFFQYELSKEQIENIIS
jgi:iron complex transport system substrate-binding protein